MALRIDSVVVKSLSCGKVSAVGLHAVAGNLMELLWDKNRLDCQLLRCILGGIRAIEATTSLSWAIDKANVGGLGLMNTVYVMPSNVIVIVAPTVSGTGKPPFGI